MTIVLSFGNPLFTRFSMAVSKSFVKLLQLDREYVFIPWKIMKKSNFLSSSLMFGCVCEFVIVNCSCRFSILAPPMQLFVILNDFLFVSLIPLALLDPMIMIPICLGMGLLFVIYVSGLFTSYA